MSSPTSYDDKGFKKALREYLNLRKNVDPKTELKRRAKNVGMRLIKLYKDKGVDLQTITSKVKSLGDHVRIRPKIRAKARLNPGDWPYKRMIAAELRARKSAKGFTSTGWFPPVEKLGGNPKREIRAGGGPRRGKLVEKLTGSDISETLINQQPGAAHIMEKNASLAQAALDAETADMVVYSDRKLRDAAKRNGL